jgi:hypothetical protein
MYMSSIGYGITPQEETLLYVHVLYRVRYSSRGQNNTPCHARRSGVMRNIGQGEFERTPSRGGGEGPADR